MNVRAAYLRSLLIATLALAPFGVERAFAAAITVEPSLQASLSFADNITLAGQGQEENEVVLAVTPALGIKGDGSRAHFDARYGLDSLRYFNVPSRSNTRQLFQGNANATLAEDLAFVEGSGWVRHQSVDPGTNAGLGELAVTEAVGQVSTWNFSPYLQHHFGGAYVVRAALVLDYLDYPGLISDSYGREYSLAVSSGERRAKLDWGLSTRTKSVFYTGESADYSLFEYNLNLRYQMVTDWALTGSAGYVSYDYPNDPSIARLPEGNSWRTGIRWTPNSRTEAEIGIGEHMFGPLKYAKLIHQSRYVSTELSYDEEITTNREIQVTANPIVVDPNTGLSQGGEVIRTETEQVFVNERTRANITYASPKAVLNLTFSNENRVYETTTGSETVTGGSVSWRWIVSPRSAWVIYYDQTTFVDINRNGDLVRNTRFSYEQRLSPKTVIGAVAQRVTRNHESPTVTDYVAHVLTFSALLVF